MNPLDGMLRTAVRAFPAPRYPAAEPGMLRMDANTNLLGPNPAYLKFLAEASSIEVHHYPTAYSSDLLAELSRVHGIPRERLIAGNGSDEILDFLAKAFLNPGDRVAVLTPSFVMYAFYARVNLGQVVEVPLGPGFSLDPDGVRTAGAKLTFIASPNNPTGNAFDADAIRRVIRESPGLVLVDEAYVEYSDQNLLGEASRSPNLIVTRTFSKAHGLAGLRVGWATASREIVEVLHRVKAPFTVGGFEEAAAVAALRDPSFVGESVATVRREREWLAAELTRRGHRPSRTDANFILVETAKPCAELAGAVRARGVLVRDLTEFRGLERAFRVTVGRRDQNERFLAALDGACLT